MNRIVKMRDVQFDKNLFVNFRTRTILDNLLCSYQGLPKGVNYMIIGDPGLDFDDNINYGSEELLQRVIAVSPRLHLFGHIHRQYGVTDNGFTQFSNGAIMNEDYMTRHMPIAGCLNSNIFRLSAGFFIRESL